MNKIIVAVDGYSSCGKSTIAKQLAAYAGYTYIDTGAMYRAVALYALRHQLDEQSLIAHLPDIAIRFSVDEKSKGACMLNGENVEQQIRTLEVGNMASKVSPLKEVRAFLVAQQQAMGRDKGIVMDGRDIGTVVFPQAELKLFLTASPQIRAQRRYQELVDKQGGDPHGINYDDVLRDVNDRDYRDTHRAESPLRKAEDAIEVDNSHMTREEQFHYIISLFEKAL